MTETEGTEMARTKTLESYRRKDAQGRALRSCKIEFCGLGYRYRMTSFDEGIVELYFTDLDGPNPGLETYMGTIREAFPGSCRDYANGDRDNPTADFARAWFACQPSKSARRAFTESIRYS
jgi:hypothetical protein